VQYLRFISIIGLVFSLAACLPALQAKRAPISEPLNVDAADEHITQPKLDISDLCLPNARESTKENDEGVWQELQLWDRIRHGYALPSRQNKRIESELNWFSKHPEYVSRVIKRGYRYWYYIVEELEARDMPLELALLPIVESGFDPFAYSPGRAAGMWQIIPGTARELGLKDTWWYDGRRDAIASTQAALNYLEALHKRFDGDWLLAIAAYNSGGGRVSRAVSKNKKNGLPTDFFSLKLPRETEAYVPRLLALAKAFKDPEQHSLVLSPLPNTPYFAEVNIGGQLDLAQASEMAEISMEELYLLNPGFNRWATDPNGPHTLLVPIDKRGIFERSLASLPSKERVTWRRHKIKPGETLSHIAKRYGVSVKTLSQVNRMKSSRIRAGTTLMVPKASKGANFYTHSQEQRLVKTINKGANGNKQKRIHVVAKGDSFWKIARQYDVRSAQVATWNKMSPLDTLSIGKKLVIWTDSAQGSVQNSDVIRKLSYKVKKGDSLARIANKFEVSIADIAKWNDINTKKYLQPGQALVVFVNVKG